jgi:hypothetical protein
MREIKALRQQDFQDSGVVPPESAYAAIVILRRRLVKVGAFFIPKFNLRSGAEIRIMTTR